MGDLYLTPQNETPAESQSFLPPRIEAAIIQRVACRTVHYYEWGHVVIAPVRQSPRFQDGQLVRHRRYGYRGVVVDHDDFCKAPDTWYNSNQTQPDREQPWYHVLVHGTNTITYAAQTSLEADDCGQPIEHPLVGQLFSGFDGEQYTRNDEPFNGW